ncbi:UBX domain-containing protein 4-like [Xenia sp. Carnegie-2017]|uniref:UBX domain-containing protein 4-like n=1 Tax=Xenia sp. Carnegie-2017 TaxID=2897299 RepID=UPI001F03E07E|nr:UBX domain-containing protein 4-like [Xenia sp. Carnegie-2017]
MIWFNGTIPQAIAESRRIGSLFIVYIKGDDEISNNMDALWENEEVKQVCLSDCTSIRLFAESNELKQFALIYPVVCIPCVYCLDGAGTPQEVIAVSLPPGEFLQKIKQAIERHRNTFPKLENDSPRQEETSSSQSCSSSSTPEASTSREVTGERSEVTHDINERVARAKKLIEEKKKERAEKEKEDAHRKEVERRKDGKIMSKAKIDREQMLAQQMADRIKNEKAKDKAAKDAIRQKIAQDKADRAAREEVQRQERRQIAARIDPSPANSNYGKLRSCSEVRIQFRLPDGSSVTQNFPADTLLDGAREFIRSRMDVRNQISFWTTFPRKHLGEDDFHKTLVDLDLAPSAALIVDLTSKTHSDVSNSSGNNSSLTWIFTLIMAPFLALISFFKFLLNSSPRAQHQPESTRPTISEDSNPSSSSLGSNARRRITRENENRFKKDGKIHSFQQDDKDDDENNTWNGNSTQQM